MGPSVHDARQAGKDIIKTQLIQLKGQFEIIKHMNMRGPNECIGDIGKCAMEDRGPHCGSNWQYQISDIN